MWSKFFCFILLLLSANGQSSDQFETYTTSTRTSTTTTIYGDFVLEIAWIFPQLQACDLEMLFETNKIDPLCNSTEISFSMFYKYFSNDRISVNFFQLDFNTISEMVDIFFTRQIFLKILWKSMSNEYYLISNNRSNTDLVIRILDPDEINGEIQNEQQIYHRFNADSIETYFNDTYETNEDITFLIYTKELNVTLMHSDSSVSLIDYPELYGNNATIITVISTDLKRFIGIERTILIELDAGLFNLVKYQNPATYTTEISDSSIKLYSKPQILEIPFKTKITSITKLNKTSFSIYWEEPLGAYDLIVLTCKIDSSNFISNYSSDVTNEILTYVSPVSGQNVECSIEIHFRDVIFECPIYSDIMDPDPVKNLTLIESTKNSLKISWDPPDGLFDHFELGLVNSKDLKVITNAYVYEFKNLSHSTSYRLSVTTVRLSKTNKIEKIYSTQYFSNIDELFQPNISLFEPDIIIGLINNLAENYLDEKDDLTQILTQTSFTLLNLANESNNSQVMLSLLDLTDKILDLSQSESIFEQNQIANRFSESLEKIISKVQVENMTNEFKKNYTNFYAKSKQVQKENFMISDIGLFLDGLTGSSITDQFFLNQNNFTYDLYFNKDSIKESIDKRPRISFIGYNNLKFFQDLNLNVSQNTSYCEQNFLSSNIISASSLTSLTPRKDLVTFLFAQQENEIKCENTSYKYSCVYWNYNSNSWKRDGCQYVPIQKDNKIIHKCICNHTTAFTLLMSYDGFKYDKPYKDILSYISLVGVCLSIIGLSITIFYDFLIAILPRTREEQRLNSENPTIKINQKTSEDYLKVIILWCTSLLIMNIAFIPFFFYSTKKSRNVSDSKCLAIGFILHFFVLCSFCFSLCLMILQYLMSCKIAMIYRFIVLKSLAFSIIVPSVVTISVTLTDENAYNRQEEYCWLSNSVILYSVVLPIGLIIFLNFLLFIWTLRHILMMLNSKKNNYVQVNDDIQKYNRRETLFIISCFLNSSLIWIFGLIPIKQRIVRYIFSSFFCILTSTHGFQILYVYLYISKTRRQILKKKLKENFQNIKMTLSRR